MTNAIYHCFLLVGVYVLMASCSPINKTVGQGINIICPIVPENAEFTSAQWKKNSSVLAQIRSNQQLEVFLSEYKDRVIEKNGSFLSLDLSNLVLTDAALYQCNVSFVIDGNPDSLASTTEVRVQDKPSPLGRPTIKNITSRTVTATWTYSDTDNSSKVQFYLLNVKKCGADNYDYRIKVNVGHQEGTLTELRANTCYNVYVESQNEADITSRSPDSEEFKTSEEDTTTTKITLTPPAEVPFNFKYTNVTSTQIELTWDPMPIQLPNGDLQGFIIKYGKDETTINNPNATNFTLTNLKPFSFYPVSIRAFNGAGPGPEVAMEVQTKEGPPSKPRIINVSQQTPTSFNVNWEPPKEPNGNLIRYKLQWIHKNTNEKRSRDISGHLIDKMAAYIHDLRPYSDYLVQVAAVTNGGEGEFSDQSPALTDVTAPSAPQNLNITTIDTNKVRLSWDPPHTVYKGVDQYIVKGWDNKGNPIQEYVLGQITEVTLTLTPNFKYHLRVAAQTSSLYESNLKYTGDFTEAQAFILGAYEHKGSNVIRDVDIRYDPDGHHSEEDLPAGIIVAIVLGILILGAVVALVIGYRFFNCRKLYQTFSYYLSVPSNGQPVPQTIIPVDDSSEGKMYPDIPVEDFIAHVDLMHVDSDIGFSNEFDEINRTSYSDKYPCDSSNMNDNRNKNRYINIVAYDHSRVMLKSELSRMRQSDYINANYVDGYKKPKAYIATQGPLPQTFADFWRMVWEQNTNVIVMITNLMEKGRRKCDQYWPNDGTETYGNMLIKLITTLPRAHYTVRVFSIKNLKVKKRHSMKGAQERTVYHYHYTEWPDHGVPDYSLPVLSFVQKSAAQSGPENGPIIVHCSAGVGRTGTYILIDSMIAQIEDKRTINIPGFIQHIRRQRNFLVQTEDQYIFIHEVLIEYILVHGITEVRDDQMSEFVQLDHSPSSPLLPSLTSGAMLDKQYMLITKYTPNELDLTAALKPINLEKNRVNSIHPVNLKRVLLPARPGVEGSDYINASYLQGYIKSSEFIVTQHPIEETMEDFWRMVWDKNSPVIVVLSPFDDVEYKEFWPPKGNSIEVDSGNFRLAMKDEPLENEDKNMVTSEFILDSIQYDYTLLTRIICVKNWPHGYPEVHKVFDAITAAHNFINTQECGPVIVMDRYGSVEAGTFCALWTLRDQYLSESCADFYQVCKLYHYKRPGIVGTRDDYLFLHQALAEYCKHYQEELTSAGSSPRHHHHHLSFHYGSIRRNGTLPRTNQNTANNTHNASNTLPRSSTHMGRSNSRESNNIVPPAPAETVVKLETNI